MKKYVRSIPFSGED